MAEAGATAGETFSITVSDGNGLLFATGAGVSGSGTKSLTITGSLTQVNADLATLADTDATQASDKITVAATDSLGYRAVGQSVAVTVNGLPQLTAPTAVTTGQGQRAAIGISLSEPGNTSGETFVVTLVDTIGLLSATGAGVVGSGTTHLTITGSLSQVNADLATLSDSVGPVQSSDTISANVTDSFGNVSASHTIKMTASGLPQLSLPKMVTVQDGVATPIAGSLSEWGAIGGETFTVKLSDTSGLLSATGLGVTGSGTTNLTITGPGGQVSYDLGTLRYTGTVSPTDTITATATDSFGNTSSTHSVAVTVAGVTPSGGNDTGGPAGQGGSLLPAGYLSTDGNQIVDSEGNPVRIASIGWDGTDSLNFAPYGLYQSSLQENMNEIAADGFNTVRIPWTDVLLHNSPVMSSTLWTFNPALDPELVGDTGLQMLDAMVQDAANAGLKVILDHHDDDGGPGGWGGQQANGLWIDSGPGTNGTDGSGTVGTVNAATFLSDSVKVAQNFAGNSTVIGFDLDNEPTSAGNINWGKGGPTDIQAMYTQVGDAIQAVDPGALIIAEGPDEWSGPAPGMPAGFAEGDLSGVATDPVTLTIPNKVVYSVHEYPPDLSHNGSYTPAQQIAAMNAGWGYLETDNIAPVWVGEMGSNMTSTADQAWIQMLLNYMNGDDGAEGGPTFSGNEQPVSGSWWQWGSAPGQDPQGVETAWGSGVYWPAQQVATDQLLYKPTVTASANTIEAQSDSAASMQFLSPAGGKVLLASTSSAPAVGVPETATVFNMGAAPVDGWSVEIDTSDILTSLTGGTLSSPQQGVYIFTPSTADAQIAANGYVSFSFDVTSLGAPSTISAHLVQQSVATADATRG